MILFLICQTFGDISEVGRYLKKAQALHTRLETAADKVSNLFKNYLFTLLFCFVSWLPIFDSNCCIIVNSRFSHSMMKRKRLAGR